MLHCNFHLGSCFYSHLLNICCPFPCAFSRMPRQHTRSLLRVLQPGLGRKGGSGSLLCRALGFFLQSIHPVLPHVQNGQKVKLASVYHLRPAQAFEVEINWEYAWFMEHHWVLYNGKFLGLINSGGREAVTDNVA